MDLSQERSSALQKAAMNRIATIASGLKARHLAALIAVALAPSGLHGRQFGPFFVAPDAQDANPTATLTPTTGNFIRISTVHGTVTPPSTDSSALFGADAVSQVSVGDFLSTVYLNKLGTFNFANDYPIISATLGLSIDSVMTMNGDIISTVDRGPFVMHQFSLLFVGTTAGGTSTSFLMSQNQTLFPEISTDISQFQLTVDGSTPALQYFTTPPTGPTPNLVNSLEWRGVVAADGTWDPNENGTINDPDLGLIIDPSNDTFPTTGDVADISFSLSSPGDALSPLYSGGAGQTSWDVFLFSTGPSLNGTFQLNLSGIIVTLEVPESSQALWGGLALLGTAEVLRRRKHAA